MTYRMRSGLNDKELAEWFEFLKKERPAIIADLLENDFSDEDDLGRNLSGLKFVIGCKLNEENVLSFKTSKIAWDVYYKYIWPEANNK